jgi:hypothetical protein
MPARKPTVSRAMPVPSTWPRADRSCRSVKSQAARAHSTTPGTRLIMKIERHPA